MNDGRLRAPGLVKQHADVTAVDDLSFAVEPGRVTGPLGPDGAGKTRTLRMLLNLVTPTAGSATIGGCRYADLREPTRVVGAVLEASGAHAGRTGGNHLRAACLAAGLPMSRARGPRAGRVDPDRGSLLQGLLLRHAPAARYRDGHVG